MKLFILLTLMILTAGARLGQPRNTSTEEVFIPSAFADSNSTQSVEHRQLQSKFRLKLYWKKGYYWQESRSEKKWCVNCDGSSCGNGDKFEIEKCKGSSQDFEFYNLNNGETQIKVSDKDLCMTLEGRSSIKARECDLSDNRQKFTAGNGSFSSDRFELIPKTKEDFCTTQQHHPKSGEKIYIADCRKARGHDTSFWEKY